MCMEDRAYKRKPGLPWHGYNALLFSCFMNKFAFNTDFPIRLQTEY